MKSYISKKFPLETRTTAQIFALRAAVVVTGVAVASSLGFDATTTLSTTNLSVCSWPSAGKQTLDWAPSPVHYQITFIPDPAFHKPVSGPRITENCLCSAYILTS